MRELEACADGKAKEFGVDSFVFKASRPFHPVRLEKLIEVYDICVYIIRMYVYMILYVCMYVFMYILYVCMLYASADLCTTESPKEHAFPQSGRLKERANG